MKTVLFLVAGGGFQWESITLARQLIDRWKFVFLVPESSTLRGSPLEALVSDHRMLRMPEVSSRAEHHAASIIRNLVRGVSVLWREVSTSKPAAAICLGSSMSIPIALVCRLRGVRVVFVESIARTDHLSATGRLLLRLRLASAVYVQWPEMVSTSPGAMYKGTVL